MSRLVALCGTKSPPEAPVELQAQPDARGATKCHVDMDDQSQRPSDDRLQLTLFDGSMQQLGADLTEANTRVDCTLVKSSELERPITDLLHAVVASPSDPLCDQARHLQRSDSFDHQFSRHRSCGFH